VLDCALGACAAQKCFPYEAHTINEAAHSEDWCEACIGLTQCRLFEVLAFISPCFHLAMMFILPFECLEGLLTFRFGVMICSNFGLRSKHHDYAALHCMLCCKQQVVVMTAV
jgi:hypothetical protein